MSKEELTNQLKNAYKSLEEEFKNKGKPNTIEDNNVDYNNCNIYAMRQKIADLEAKLAESEKNVEFYQERYSDATTSAYGADLIAKNIQSRLEEEIRELKQQLAEKEKEIARLKELNIDIPIKQMQFHHNQDKISFAVEQLEKVKEFVIRQLFITIKGCSDLDEAEAKGCNELREETIKEIDNQIKQLKEGK